MACRSKIGNILGSKAVAIKGYNSYWPSLDNRNYFSSDLLKSDCLSFQPGQKASQMKWSLERL